MFHCVAVLVVLFHSFQLFHTPYYFYELLVLESYVHCLPDPRTHQGQTKSVSLMQNLSSSVAQLSIGS